MKGIIPVFIIFWIIFTKLNSYYQHEIIVDSTKNQKYSQIFHHSLQEHILYAQFTDEIDSQTYYSGIIIGKNLKFFGHASFRLINGLYEREYRIWTLDYDWVPLIPMEPRLHFVDNIDQYGKLGYINY